MNQRPVGLTNHRLRRKEKKACALSRNMAHSPKHRPPKHLCVRRGRYDLGAEGNALWREEIQKVEAVFDMVPLRGRVLEPTAGSGNCTLYLTRRAEKVTVLDNSRSMIEKNRRRVQEAGLQERVDYEETALVCWHPRVQYEAILLGFWISHLPSVVLDPFLLLMASARQPGGCLAILEGQRNGRLRSATRGTSCLDDEIELRTLNDGRTFRIVKRYDDPEDLAERLERAGLDAQVGASGEQLLTPWLFRPARILDSGPHSDKGVDQDLTRLLSARIAVLPTFLIFAL